MITPEDWFLRTFYPLELLGGIWSTAVTQQFKSREVLKHVQNPKTHGLFSGRLCVTLCYRCILSSFWDKCPGDLGCPEVVCGCGKSLCFRGSGAHAGSKATDHDCYLPIQDLHLGPGSYLIFGQTGSGIARKCWLKLYVYVVPSQKRCSYMRMSMIVSNAFKCIWVTTILMSPCEVVVRQVWRRTSKMRRLIPDSSHPFAHCSQSAGVWAMSQRCHCSCSFWPLFLLSTTMWWCSGSKGVLCASFHIGSRIAWSTTAVGVLACLWSGSSSFWMNRPPVAAVDAARPCGRHRFSHSHLLSESAAVIAERAWQTHDTPCHGTSLWIEPLHCTKTKGL